MFNFFKKKAKADENTRQVPNKSVASTSRSDHDVTTNEKSKLRKDVVNLLIPETDYNQKTGVGAFLDIMAGKRKKIKRKPGRTESVRISPPKETKNSLQRSKSERETRHVQRSDVSAGDSQNNPDAAEQRDGSADFVKALVLEKYAPKDKTDKHVSLVYVTPDLSEKQHAEALLREIARSIDCTVDKITEEMGGTDSKNNSREQLYETIEERSPIENYKNELKGELDKLLKENDADNKSQTLSIESPNTIKKSNLKPPRSDTEGCSDDDRSDCGKKRVTFQKHIVFDDGDRQTDEDESSFESLTDEEEEEEYLEDNIPDNDELIGGDIADNNEVIAGNVPDNDELLGGYIVSDNRTVINVNENELKRISSDNSDSGFIDTEKPDDMSVKSTEVSDSESESESEVSESETEEEVIEVIEEIEEIAELIEPNDPRHVDNQKSLVSHENKFQSQVAALTELAENRCDEAQRAKDLIASYRKQLEAKDQQIEQLKCELASAYKESELVRQRSRSLEDELAAARRCSADLADELKSRNDECVRQLRAELEDSLAHRAELESRLLALERDKEQLERDKATQEQRAQEALASAEANTEKWRLAHEAARSQAAARAERMLADCEWKMRELERKAREAEKQKKELTETVTQLKSNPQPTQAQAAELQQLRGVVSEHQRSVQALTLQLQRVETREESLKLELHRLKDLLEKESRIAKEKEERHLKTVENLEQTHSKAIETLKAEHAAAAASSRSAFERMHAERTRKALAQLRAESDQEVRNADRKLREVTTRFENLKEVLAAKEAQFEEAISEAHSKADWDIMQLRHLLDKADIQYANNVEQMTERFENERDRLNEEWSEKLRTVEEQAASAADEAKKLLDTTKMKLIAEKNDQIHKLKEQHRLEMEEQWEQFMADKETCLTRMKAECTQEGEEERVKREKELLEEIAELKAQVQSKSVDFDNLAVKAAACGRTLAVTEQELREALDREKELRSKRAEDQTKIKQVERANKDQIEHLTRKCACLRKLFDDMRARLTSREKIAEEQLKAKDKEINHLRAELARLTKMLVLESSPSLGTRTRADGCETVKATECPKGNKPIRKRPTLPELPIKAADGAVRPRAKSVDLPAVQVPVRIKQLEELNIE